MLFIRRKLTRNENDIELLWFGVSTISLSLAAIWFWLGLPWPRCTFHGLTGLPCLTCGMTRCAIQFFHGHFFAALAWNPLIFVALCAIALFNVYAAIVLVVRAPRVRITSFTRSERKFACLLILGVLGINWIYLLAHARSF